MNFMNANGALFHYNIYLFIIIIVIIISFSFPFLYSIRRFIIKI